MPNPAPHSAQALARRRLITALPLGIVAPALWAQADPSGPPALAFVGFELIDDQPDPARLPVHQARLAQVSRQMADGLAERGLYRVVDLAARPTAQQALQRARAENEYLHRCNGCLAGIGAAASAPLVGVGWVQRVSNLILNLNLAVWAVDPAGGEDRMTLTKSVDIRGDNDESWRRGVAYMLRDMAERRARQPRYGL
ncbi:DUF3280 domain-containing protein [Sphaerotilus microaerophilus]|uniref:DUF2380 domain-containing protein n=1 Tax=Sphaerotilus microaerophilus TaxID=2914710 RepID=A0ABM7YQ01_9BURK|nr:DUF3280 domain-containing protein [Sphaerotilus sp. FB-5]BDI06628.1 hypothetical protein CATMQ487_35980 [Sphaerotilus sp. FB-5]